MRIAQIRPVSPLGDVHLDNDNVDVQVHLEDGRVYSFLLATPKNIYWCMDNERIDYFFGVPPVFVRQLTADNIRRALEAIIAEDSGKWLQVYGVLQEQTT
jgi:uncharacterized membrane protein YpjA